MKIILDLCGGTGAWSKPYKDAGYDVRLITLPGDDVRLYVPPKNVYGILAAPPCTHFAGSGARWWKEKGEQALLDGLSVVDACLRIVYVCKPMFWCLENPIGRLSKHLGQPIMYMQPCDYGDAYTKRTCLWGKFNAPYKKPCVPEFVILPDGKKMSKIHHDSFGLPPEKRSEVRSITPQGFAQAFYEANK